MNQKDVECSEMQVIKQNIKKSLNIILKVLGDT